MSEERQGVRRGRGGVLAACLCWVAALGARFACPAVADQLGAFSYADTAEAQQHWQPQFGSKPARVETLEDGTPCLALDADIAKQGDRACWDWQAPLDLSQVGRIGFDVSATNGSLGGTVGIFFGTRGGWYARFWGGLPEVWTPRTFRLEDFGTEDKPEGWDKVTTFRFSVWSTGAGKCTFRLRNLSTMPSDPAESFLPNGSFEIIGADMPYGWGSGHWGVGDLPWAADMDLWRRHWHLDRTVAKAGVVSLCLENTPELPLLKAQSVWRTPAASVKACVLSAWLKSDQPKLPVTLSCGGRGVTVEVGTEWVQGALKAIPRAERLIAAIAPSQPGKLWIDAVQLQECEEPTPEFHASYDDAGLAAREKLVDWTPPRRTPETAAGRDITGPVKAARATIDEHGRFLLDGVPYLQHSFGLEFVSDLDILDFVAKSGFKDVCVQIRPGITTDQLKGYFDRCAQVGLRLIPWLDGRIPLEQFREHVATLKEHPALLCWYVYDEPSGERFAEANARLKLAKELDPSRPALINYLPDKLTDHLGDLYSTDVYPIPHSSPLAAINAVAQMKIGAEKEKKPVWMWLQGTGYAYWMDREPTPRELSCMVYGSLMAGARGLYYFAQVPRTKACFDEMRALLVEVDALAPALGSLDPAPEVACSAPNVMCKAYSHEGEVLVAAVNTTSAGVEARLSLPGAKGAAEVMFEGREVQAADGQWTDRFGGHERHVYRWAVGHAPANGVP